MKVLYVSKAMAAGAYRDKLRVLAGLVELSALVPARWGDREADPGGSDEPWLETATAVLHGHNHFHAYRGLRSRLRSDRPDLVHIDEEPYSAVTAQLARHCARERVPFVFFAWQNLEKWIPPPFGAMRSYVFRRAGGGIAGTADAARVLRAWGWTGLLDVIPQLGVDPSRFQEDSGARAGARARIGAGDDDFVVGFGGRLVAGKGVRLLVRSAAALPHTRLVLIGDGPERDAVLELAARLGSRDRLHMPGRVSSTEMPAWLCALDALALPSVRTRGWVEQFGRILVEAMAAGVPVVGSTSGEIPNVIGNAGLVCREGDIDSLTAALRRLAESPALRHELARRGRQRVCERFTNEHIARDTASFYERVLAEAA